MAATFCFKALECRRIDAALNIADGLHRGHELGVVQLQFLRRERNEASP